MRIAQFRTAIGVCCRNFRQRPGQSQQFSIALLAAFLGDVCNLMLENK